TAEILVPLPFAERAVVVRAAILERVELAVAVVDADRGPADRDDLRGAWAELGERRDVDLRHYLLERQVVAHALPLLWQRRSLALCRATLRTPMPRMAHFRRIGVSGMPISSSRSSFGIVATSEAVRPLTISVSIDVAACEIAQPRPSKEMSEMTSPSKRT